ncbi:hypothetical protein I5Q31_05635 [Serratia marcescens]|nr:hypothetical protein [Serratia marcescens]MBH2766649.1 hypothetical protein [Serratia marcescens]MBH2766709.1 hypothetical protein [Serratia marcescens]
MTCRADTPPRFFFLLSQQACPGLPAAAALSYSVQIVVTPQYLPMCICRFVWPSPGRRARYVQLSPELAYNELVQSPFRCVDDCQRPTRVFELYFPLLATVASVALRIYSEGTVRPDEAARPGSALMLYQEGKKKNVLFFRTAVQQQEVTEKATTHLVWPSPCGQPESGGGANVPVFSDRCAGRAAGGRMGLRAGQGTVCGVVPAGRRRPGPYPVANQLRYVYVSPQGEVMTSSKSAFFAFAGRCA